MLEDCNIPANDFLADSQLSVLRESITEPCSGWALTLENDFRSTRSAHSSGLIRRQAALL